MARIGQRPAPTPGTLDVAGVRARFAALQRPLAFFDGPGGTQCPDSVIDAIADYLRTSNANLGGAFETSARTDELVEHAHERGAEFLGCQPGEVAFGPSMTGLNFLLSRALARTLESGDEIVVTTLDHDANVAPWLELQRDLGIVVHVAGVTDDLRLDLDDVASRLSERTRVVAFPAAANSVGTSMEVTRVVELAHSVGALAWVDAVHYAPHEPIDVASWDADVVICSAYKFFGPHLGLAYGRADVLASWRPYKVRPAPDEPVARQFELGTLPHELLAGFVAAVDYIDALGWDAIRAHEEVLGERFLDGLPSSIQVYGPTTMEGRVPTFCFRVPGRTPREVSTFLGARDIAVWDGNYYAIEVFRHLGLEDGAVRAGFVHYNTAEEVHRLLEALHALV